jgi:hypothetical protein
MLIEVKKEVKHGEWEPWLCKNCPDISDRTARMYMRFAKPENAKKLEAAAEENGNAVADLSVRGAAKLLSTPRTGNGGGGNGGGKGNGKAVAQAASPDLKDLLQNVSPDELIKALHEAAWDKEQIQKLVSILTAALKPPVPSEQRAPPPQAEGAKETQRRSIQQ